EAQCVSIEENPNTWGFWTWWTSATKMSQYGGGGEYYYYDLIRNIGIAGFGSDWAQDWVLSRGNDVAGPVGTVDPTYGQNLDSGTRSYLTSTVGIPTDNISDLGAIRLFVSTPAGGMYGAEPLRLGFKVLEIGNTPFWCLANDKTSYGWLPANLDSINETEVDVRTSLQIIEIDPPAAMPGTPLTITGTGFSSVLGNNTVRFGINSLPITGVNSAGTEITGLLPFETNCGIHQVWVEVITSTVTSTVTSKSLELTTSTTAVSRSNVVDFRVLKPGETIHQIAASVTDFLADFQQTYTPASRPARPGINLLERVIKLLMDEKSRMDHLDRLDKGMIVAALTRIEQAIRMLEQFDKMYAEKTGISTEDIQEELARYAEALLRIMKYEAEKNARTPKELAKVWKANEHIKAGSSGIEEGEYLKAAHQFKKASTQLVSLKPKVEVGKCPQANWSAEPYLPKYLAVGETVPVGFKVDNLEDTAGDIEITGFSITVDPTTAASWTYIGMTPSNYAITLPYYIPVTVSASSDPIIIDLTCNEPGLLTLSLVVNYRYIADTQQTGTTLPAEAQCNQIRVEIDKPEGSLDADPNPVASWLVLTERFDFQGIKAGAPGAYVLDIEGDVDPIPPVSYKWTLDAAAGTLANDTTATPVHTAPAAEGEGTLTLKAMVGATDTGWKDERKVKIYKDCLERDKVNFATGISCRNPWSFTRFNVPINMTSTWNCHGSTIHAYDGSGNGSAAGLPAAILGWAKDTFTPPITWANVAAKLDRGDIVAFYAGAAIQHTHTCVGGTTTWGANNEAVNGPETWKWNTCTS
ncbi:MAG: hypothetical protein KAJ19_05625, partial [Gammaproteobacteria bacterium]|nr:hypothetical protein [Gammaproteobacteria bacterium]